MPEPEEAPPRRVVTPNEVHAMAKEVIDALVVAYGKRDPGPAMQVLADAAAQIIANAPADQVILVLEDYQQALKTLVTGYAKVMAAHRAKTAVSLTDKEL